MLQCFSFVVFVDYWTDEKENSTKSQTVNVFWDFVGSRVINKVKRCH